jgi:putative tRNA adenosine deaminase-associated protein
MATSNWADDDDADIITVAALHNQHGWQCRLLSNAGGRHLPDAERELERLRASNTVVLGFIDVDDEFLILLRLLPAGVRLLLSDATAAMDYSIAADALRKLNLEVPDIDLNDSDDTDPWPEGDLNLMADLGLDGQTLSGILTDVELYADEQLEKIAQRLGFASALKTTMASHKEADLVGRAATLARTNAGPLSYEELLRVADNWPNQIPAESTIRRFPVGIAESSLAPVYLDFNRCQHCIIIGDAQSGKTSLLRSIVRSICASNSNNQARIVVADYRRTLLSEIPDEYLGGWCTTVETATELMAALRDALRERMPDPNVTPQQRVNRSWWSGPDAYVIVDDYDMVAASASNPMDTLLELLPHARDLGFHVIIARRADGAGRAMLQPVLACMRDLGSARFIMSCERGEDVLIGTTKPSRLSPGQGTLVTAESEELIRISWLPPASGGTPRR